MKSQILALRVAGAAFGLMAVAQIVRLVMRPTVLVAGHQIPLWPSIVAVVILGGLCVWMLGVTRGPRLPAGS